MATADSSALEHHPMVQFIELYDKEHNVTEVEIPIPYGKLAGKWFGPKNVRPIVCLHGWLDNSGTFDRLIPLLPADVSFLSIDLPGHGHSSRIPDGMAYTELDYLPLLLYVMREYNWTKISLLAHSMGAIVGFMFAAFFPDKVDLLIGLDSIRPFTLDPDNFIELLPSSVLKMVAVDIRNQERTEPPAYTYEEMVDRLEEGTAGSVTKEVCPYLLQRNIKRSRKFPDRYFFDRDNRIKYILLPGWDHKMNLKMASLIKAPFMTVKATQSMYGGSKEEFDEIVKMLKDSNPLYEFVYVEGTHHVHLTEPENVAPVIVEFLKKHWRKEDEGVSKL